MFGVGDMGGVNALLWSDGFTVNASLNYNEGLSSSWHGGDRKH